MSSEKYKECDSPAARRNYVKVTFSRRTLDKRESGQTYRLAVDGFNR
jgi:hypothetical protein